MKNRVIIIIWSWRSRGHGEGVWTVINGRSVTGDEVICRDLPNSPNAIEELRLMVDTYRHAGAEIMLFLHRQHGYHQEHVQQLLTQTTDVNCFLFGEGADPLYLTNSPRGLLGTSGTFSAGINYDGQVLERTAVANEEEQQLRAANFNYVWELYEEALYQKLFELREDLFGLLSGQLPQIVFPEGKLYTILKEVNARPVLLRLLSLAGRIKKHSNLAQELRTFEQTAKRTLTFNTSFEQIEASYGHNAAASYTALVHFVAREVLSGKATVDILQLRVMFDELLGLVKTHTQ